MQIVFLPGMDGTGQLFPPELFSALAFASQVIPLPDVGDQDYGTLIKHVGGQLPSTEFVLIAESFSGPIAYHLAADNFPNLKAVVFVAAFLSSPKKLVLALARFLPLKILVRLPMAGVFVRRLMMGRDVDDAQVQQFIYIISTLHKELLQKRIETIVSLPDYLSASNSLKIKCPAFYLQARQDKLVPFNKAAEFETCFQNFDKHTIDGPHFLLQTKPDECARMINEFIGRYDC